MATFDFQLIASTLSSFSPPRALMALSSTALGSVSAARTRLVVADTNKMAKAARRDRFMKIASLIRGSFPARRSHIPKPDRAVVLSGDHVLQSYAVCGVG